MPNRMDHRDGPRIALIADAEILDAKAKIGAGGLGCEPASAASVAGLRQLVREGVIDKDSRVVCVLTGNGLKDPTTAEAFATAVTRWRQNVSVPVLAAPKPRTRESGVLILPADISAILP